VANLDAGASSLRETDKGEAGLLALQYPDANHVTHNVLATQVTRDVSDKQIEKKKVTI